ncbi:MAG: hypothetical protein ACMXYM_02885 [Candidatus Woesearchaeota archaeon]
MHGVRLIIEEPTQSYAIEERSDGYVLRIPHLLTYEVFEFIGGELRAHLKSEDGSLVETYEFDDETLESNARWFHELIENHPDALGSLMKHLP